MLLFSCPDEKKGFAGIGAVQSFFIFTTFKKNAYRRN